MIDGTSKARDSGEVRYQSPIPSLFFVGFALLLGGMLYDVMRRAGGAEDLSQALADGLLAGVAVGGAFWLFGGHALTVCSEPPRLLVRNPVKMWIVPASVVASIFEDEGISVVMSDGVETMIVKVAMHDSSQIPFTGRLLAKRNAQIAARTWEALQSAAGSHDPPQNVEVRTRVLELTYSLAGFLSAYCLTAVLVYALAG